MLFDRNKNLKSSFFSTRNTHTYVRVRTYVIFPGTKIENKDCLKSSYRRRIESNRKGSTVHERLWYNN